MQIRTLYLTDGIGDKALSFGFTSKLEHAPQYISITSQHQVFLALGHTGGGFQDAC